MSPGATFERVYRSLKAELGSGRFRPGDPLEPAALSSELNSSITPVRDALHRLVGEGLVEAPRGDGFRAPLITEVGLRHLYAWNGWLLASAMRKGGRESPAASPELIPDAVVNAAPVEALFLRIALLSGNPEHATAVASASDRLRAARRVESAILGDTEAEAAQLHDHIEDAAALRSSLASYHRRRLRVVHEIVAALHAG